VIVTRRPSWNGLWNETVFSGSSQPSVVTATP
jgi:hypothetical protein